MTHRIIIRLSSSNLRKWPKARKFWENFLYARTQLIVLVEKKYQATTVAAILEYLVKNMLIRSCHATLECHYALSKYSYNVSHFNFQNVANIIAFLEFVK